MRDVLNPGKIRRKSRKNPGRVRRLLAAAKNYIRLEQGAHPMHAECICDVGVTDQSRYVVGMTIAVDTPATGTVMPDARITAVQKLSDNLLRLTIRGRVY